MCTEVYDSLTKIAFISSQHSFCSSSFHIDKKIKVDKSDAMKLYKEKHYKLRDILFLLSF